ncbi:hypothetical protein [uncultured Variovorax sp.]|uniref:hypothetical protein n=1 Tax=uncultured Variovorax sp. TaxID=114708 RepID=UPI0025FFB7EB|nr:hypothetical protein [uncultured Variovorax sp.]
MAAALTGRPSGRASGAGDSRRYWAPCIGIALVAMFLFYVTLTDLVKESAARAAAQVAVMPAVVQAPLRMSTQAPEPAAAEAPVRMAAVVPAARRIERSQPAELSPVVAKPVRLEVTKCVTPSGEAEYSDGPCSEGARATTLRLQQ